MRKILVLLFIAFSLISCDKDEKPFMSEYDFLGSWNIYNTNGYIEFKSNNYIMYNFNRYHDDGTQSSGEYTCQGAANLITFKYEKYKDLDTTFNVICDVDYDDSQRIIIIYPDGEIITIIQ